MLRLVVASGALALLFARIPLGEVVAAVGGARPGLILLALAAALGAELVASGRLAVIVHAHGIEVPRSEVFAVNATARLYAIALPAGNAAALAVRIHQLTGGTGRYVDGFRSTILDRVGATTLLAAIGVGGWLLDRGAARDGIGGARDAVGWPVPVTLAAALVLLLVLHAALLTRRPLPLVAALLAPLERRWPARFGPLRPAWAPSMRPIALSARIWAWSLCAHALGIFSLAALARALGLEVSVLTVAWTRSAALLLATLPISVAGLGVREGAFVVLLGGAGVPAPEALGFSLLAYGVTVVAVALLGGFFEVRRVLS